MKMMMLLVLLLWQTASDNESPVARPDAMRYERAIRMQAGEGQVCAGLDAQIFPHAAPSLADLRIFPFGPGSAKLHEVPYVLTLSEAMTEETQAAPVLNLGSDGGKVVFNLEMPQRAYTDVTLHLDPAAENFLATATVSGSNSLSGGKSTALGSFTLFDLSSQRLSRDTTIPLVESTFHYLHIVLSFSVAPGPGPRSEARFGPAIVLGAEVPPSREAQTVYTTVAETGSITTVGRESRATFEVPPRVPMERVSFDVQPDFKGNFSRNVRVTALARPEARSGEDDRIPLPETVTGKILRVHATESGHEIRSEQMGIPAILGANLQSAAKVDVVIENGDDQPLPITSVRLEMRQREVCFDAASGETALALYYGDPRLFAPVYDYDRLFVASGKALVGELGPERPNRDFRGQAPNARTFTERHPEVLWIALLAVICALGVVALKSSRNARL